MIDELALLEICGTRGELELPFCGISCSQFPAIHFVLVSVAPGRTLEYFRSAIWELPIGKFSRGFRLDDCFNDGYISVYVVPHPKIEDQQVSTT